MVITCGFTLQLSNNLLVAYSLHVLCVVWLQDLVHFGSSTLALTRLKLFTNTRLTFKKKFFHFSYNWLPI